jgi:predicted porin
VKRLLVTGTTLGCTIAPMATMAQSSVTLYGLVDEGLNCTNTPQMVLLCKCKVGLRKAAGGA